MKYTYRQLEEKAKMRKDGYMNAVLASSRKIDDEYYEINDKERDRLVKEYPVVTLGLGDMVGTIATPIARGLNMGCIDKETNELRPDSPCAKRKKLLNSLVSINLPHKSD